MKLYSITVLLFLALTLPTFAAEAPEATQKRVRELEKANLVLQEDLARTQLELDTTKGTLKRTQAALDKEIAERKALAAALDKEIAERQDKLDRMQKQFQADLLAQQAAMNEQFAKLQKAMADQATQFAKDMATLKDGFDKQIATLGESLDKEHAQRLAAEDKATKESARLDRYSKKNRTLTYVFSALLGGAIAATK